LHFAQLNLARRSFQAVDYYLSLAEPIIKAERAGQYREEIYKLRAELAIEMDKNQDAIKFLQAAEEDRGYRYDEELNR
jgi:hypothetical protein